MMRSPDSRRLDAVRDQLDPGLPLRLLYVTETQCAGLVGPVVLNITQAEPDDDVVRATSTWVDEVARSFPDGSGFIVIIQASAPPPGDEAKKRIATIYRHYERSARAGAIVVEGGGFRGAAIRAAMNLFSFGWSYKFSTKICATVEEGASFVFDKIPSKRRPSVDEMVRCYSAMRRAFSAAS